MEELFLESYSRFMHLSWKVIRLSRKNLSEMGFAWNQYIVMKSINPGEAVTLSEIGARAFKESSNITALVDFLEEKGIVRRFNDPNDRRVIRAKLTKEGERIRQDIICQHNAFICALFEDMSKEALNSFLKVIKILDAKIE